MEFNNFDLNLLTFLETNNLKSSDKNCFNYFGKWYKFEDLYSESYRYAKLLTKAGFKKGDRVALSLLGFPESIFLLFASSYIGLDIAMWDVRNNVESFRHLCTRIKPKAIFVCEWDLRFVLRISKEFKDINVYYISLTESINRTISNFRISFYALASFCVPYTKNVINFRSLCKLPITDIDLPLPSKSHKIYFPTSGSTGQSKYVILSSKHFNYQILQFFNKIQNHDINVVTNKSFLNFLPLFTSTGLLMHLNAMFLGIEQFIYPQPFPHRVWKWIIKNKVNYIFGPTKFYDDMMKYRFIKRTRDLSFLELLFCGGDILTERKEKQINEFLKQRKSKGQLINAYGLTETTAYISIQDKDKHTPGSCGKILPNVDIKILNIDNEDFFAENDIGKILIKCPCLMEGYLKFDSLNNEYIEKCDEYLKTGDIGYINNNELFIKGRLSRMVTMKNGCKFYCDDYEKRIKSLSYIDDAAVICDNEADKEREVLLFLKFIKNEKREFKVFKTVDYIRKNMNPFEYPTKVYVVDKFPLLSSMKKDYVLLKKYAKTKILKRVL